VDLDALIRDDAALAPLDDATLSVGEDGWSLLWPQGAEVRADTLWRPAREHSGEAIPVAEFCTWRTRNRLSLTDAAKALGITRRMVSYYAAGHSLIPRLVSLACKGREAEQTGHS
jgi:hypothetical protein